jgi:hypothetical protein
MILGIAGVALSSGERATGSTDNDVTDPPRDVIKQVVDDERRKVFIQN